LSSSLTGSIASQVSLCPIEQVTFREKLADRAETLATALRTMSDREPKTAFDDDTMVILASKIYAARRSVDEIFGLPGFAVSPGWDMVLNLYQAKIEDRKLSVTNACAGGACPLTTGLRWLQVLENMEFVTRAPDLRDGRRHVVLLTEAGRLKVENALASYLLEWMLSSAQQQLDCGLIPAP